MLLAEIHGKLLGEARDSEDYLTSAVFGHLRYIGPAIFWHELFLRACGSEQSLPNLARSLLDRGISIEEYDHLETFFWPDHPTLGQPDLVLCFSAPSKPRLYIVVEVKLWAEKSGFDERDQLARYLRLLDELPELGLPFDPADRSTLVYLTPRDSYSEVQQSLATLSDPDAYRSRIYRLQWQDILAVADLAQHQSRGLARTILSNVAEFLRLRNLEYFDGFRTIPGLPEFAPDCGAFYSRGGTGLKFRSLTKLPISVPFKPERGGWAT